jgi:hypothetical protein
MTAESLRAVQQRNQVAREHYVKQAQLEEHERAANKDRLIESEMAKEKNAKRAAEQDRLDSRKLADKENILANINEQPEELLDKRAGIDDAAEEILHNEAGLAGANAAFDAVNSDNPYGIPVPEEFVEEIETWANLGKIYTIAYNKAYNNYIKANNSRTAGGTSGKRRTSVKRGKRGKRVKQGTSGKRRTNGKRGKRGISGKRGKRRTRVK